MNPDKPNLFKDKSYQFALKVVSLRNRVIRETCPPVPCLAGGSVPKKSLNYQSDDTNAPNVPSVPNAPKANFSK